MSPLNSVGLSPTSAGELPVVRPNPPVARVTADASAVNSAVQDWVQIANVPAFVQVEPLQATNPAQFQLVLSDAIRQLRAAEFQTTDPIQRAYLASLADRFQKLQETGSTDLSKSATATR
jgi:hypothetical protein